MRSKTPHPFRSSRRWLAVVFVVGCSQGSPGDEITRWETDARTETQLRQVLEQNPEDAAAHFGLACVLADEGRATEADEHFRRADELAPNREKTIEDQRRHFLRAYQKQALDLLEDGVLDGVAPRLDGAEAMVAGDAHTAYLRGRLHLAEGNPEAAVPFLRVAWEADPGKKEYKEPFREALLGQGQDLYQDKQYDRAWEALSQANEVESTSDLDYLRGLVAYSWAESQESDERWERLAWAEDAFRSVLKHDPRDTDATFNLGAVLMASDQFEEASAIYRRLLAESPTDGGLYLALSRVHSMSGESDLALTEEAVGKALRAGDPVDNPEIWARRAADRFVESDLALVYEELGSPGAVYTYTVPGGVLVEVWFYRDRQMVEAFREGGRVGPSVYLEK